MELDINPEWVSLMTYTGTSRMTITPTKLLSNMERPADRYLHTFTGRLFPKPQTENPHAFIKLRAPGTAAVQINGRPVVTFPKLCPVCRSGWKFANAPKIMDLVTKGEAPFAHLIAAQVRIQPPSSQASVATPNAGRKSLLFSDVRVDERSRIERAVILPHVEVGKGCSVIGAVIDEGCVITDGIQIGVDRGADAHRFEVTDKGVVLVTPGMLRRLEAAAR